MFLSLVVKFPFYSLFFTCNYFLFATQDLSVWHRFITPEILLNNCYSWFCWQNSTSTYKYSNYADGNKSRLHGLKSNCFQKTMCSLWYSFKNTFQSHNSRFFPFTQVSTTSFYCFPPLFLAHSPHHLNMPGFPTFPPHPALIAVSTCHFFLLWPEVVQAALCLIWILTRTPC